MASAAADAATHPVLGVLYALDTAEAAGPALMLEPDGATFDRPVTVEIPAAMIDSADPGSRGSPIALVGNADSVEVVPVRDLGGGRFAVEIEHFSVLQVVWTKIAALGELGVWTAGAAFEKLRKAGRNVPDLIEYGLGSGPVTEAFATLPTVQQMTTDFARGAACASTGVATVTAGDLPDRWTLLKWLGWHSDGRPADRSSGAATGPRTGPRGSCGRDPQRHGRRARTCRPAPRGDGGDRWRPLRRADGGAQRPVRRTRPAGSWQGTRGCPGSDPGDGGDESGAYYHLFGMAAFAFASKVIDENYASMAGRDFDPQVEWGAEFSATIEETFFASDGGDISGDPTEYAVDLLGARLGTELFVGLRGRSRGELERDFSVSPADCVDGVPGSIGGIDGYVAALVDEPGIVTVREAAAVDAGEVEMCSLRHGGRDCRAAVLTALADQPFPSIEEATRFVCEQLQPGTFRSPPLADGWVADFGGRSVTVDDWGSLDIGLCGEIVNEG